MRVLLLMPLTRAPIHYTLHGTLGSDQCEIERPLLKAFDYRLYIVRNRGQLDGVWNGEEESQSRP